MPRKQGAKLGVVAQPLRAALTGRSTSPGIFDVLAVLGREESLGRIEDQAKVEAARGELGGCLSMKALHPLYPRPLSQRERGERAFPTGKG